MPATYQFRRFSEGAGSVLQDNRAAPCRRGWWAFPAGYEYHADNVPRKRDRRWRTLIVPADALIYVGWNRQGRITRDGFFNSGDWQYLSVEDAMTGLRRFIVSCRAISVAHETWKGMPLHRVIDSASLQAFIPASVRIR